MDQEWSKESFNYIVSVLANKTCMQRSHPCSLFLLMFLAVAQEDDVPILNPPYTALMR